MYADRPFEASKQRAKQVKITSLYQGELRESGKTLIGKCPLHNDTGNPNFRIYPETNSFHCFSCGKGGDVIQFMRDLKGLSFVEAMKELNK